MFDYSFLYAASFYSMGIVSFTVLLFFVNI